MKVEQKILKSRCRACGTTSTLDNTHRVTSFLMKNLPKDMDEIGVNNEISAAD